MNRIYIYLILMSAAVVAAISHATAQETAETKQRLILSVRAKLIPEGLEMSFEHAVSEKFSLRSALGTDMKREGDFIYRNKEVYLALLSNSKVYPYGFTVGPYLKLKDSHYDYYHPITESMLDVYTSLYFLGAGVTAEYRQRIGSRFMISPFVRFGVNKVLIRTEYGPGEPFFTDSFETDPGLGIAVSFVF
jgi:hypothetical protein